MPFFRCHLPKFDSPKPPFRFDNNSWPTYLRNSIISNEEKQQENENGFECYDDDYLFFYTHTYTEYVEM